MGEKLPIHGQSCRSSQGLAPVSCVTSAVARRKPMPNSSALQSLNQAIQRYFDLMYDSDTSRFGRVFQPLRNWTDCATGNLDVAGAGLPGNSRRAAVAAVAERPAR